MEKQKQNNKNLFLKRVGKAIKEDRFNLSSKGKKAQINLNPRLKVCFTL